MSEKIRIDLENGTGKGFAEIVEDLARIGKAGAATAQAMAALSRGLGSVTAGDVTAQLGGLVEANNATEEATYTNSQAQDALSSALSSFSIEASAAASSQQEFSSSLDVGGLQGFKDEVEKTSTSLGGLQKAADSSGESVVKGTTKWQKLQAAWDLTKGAFSALKTGFEMVSEFSQKMAEDGNSSFQELVDAGQGFQDALMEIADDEVVSGMVRELAQNLKGLTSGFVEAGKAAFKGFGMLQDAVTGVTRGILQVGSALGVLSDDIVESYDEEGRAVEQLRKKRDEAHREELAQRKEQRAKAEEQARFEKEQADAKKKKQLDKLADPGAALRAEEARAAHIAGFKDLEGQQGINEEINHVLAYQKQLIEEISQAGRDPAEDDRVRQNAEDLADLERRRLDIIRDREAAMKEAEGLQERQQETANNLLTVDQQRNDAAERGVKLRRESRKADIEAAGQQGDLKAPRQRGHGRDEGGDEGLQNPMAADPKFAAAAAQLRAKMTRMKPAIRKQVIKNREDQAVAQLRVKQKKRRVTDPDQRKQEEQAVRSKARNQARNDMARGKFSNEEQEKAVSDLTNGAAGMIKKQGGLDKSSVQALEQLTKQANQRAEESSRMQDQLDRLNDALRNLNSRGSNSTNRAQR